MGAATNLQYFHLFLGIVLCLTGMAMLLYAILRPEHRGVPIMFGAIAYILGGLFWLSSGIAIEAPGRVQVLLGGLRALPWDVALAYICYLIVRSVGKNYPRTERILTTGIYVLPCLPLLIGVVCAVYFPQPAIDFTTTGTAEVLVPRIRNVIEIGYLILITTVFWREAFQRSTLRLMAQNAFLTMAGLSLLAAMFLNITISAARVMIDGSDDLVAFLATTRDLQLSSLVLAGLLLLVGIVLYDSVEDRERLLSRCRDWIKHRHDIEATSHIIFGKGLGNSHSGARVSGYYYRAAKELHISHREREQGRLTIVLLALMLDPEYQDKVEEVRKAQRELLEAPEISPFSLTLPDDGIHYNIQDDDLFHSLGYAMTLHNYPAASETDLSYLSSIYHTGIQLAAVLAADAKFLPEPLRTIVLNGHSNHTTRQVLDVYYRAKRDENSIAL